MLVRWYFLLCAFYCVWGAGLFDSRKRKRTATIERIDKTCGARTMPIVINYRRFKIVDNIAYMNSTITINEDIPDDPRMAIDVERCKAKENPDSCEHFHKLKMSSYCNSLKAPGYYDTYIATFEPPHTCPLKKGVYKTDHGVIDMRAIIVFPLSGWYWKAKVQILEKKSDRKLMCTLWEVKYA